MYRGLRQPERRIIAKRLQYNENQPSSSGEIELGIFSSFAFIPKGSLHNNLVISPQTTARPVTRAGGSRPPLHQEIDAMTRNRGLASKSQIRGESTQEDLSSEATVQGHGASFGGDSRLLGRQELRSSGTSQWGTSSRDVRDPGHTLITVRLCHTTGVTTKARQASINSHLSWRSHVHSSNRAGTKPEVVVNSSRF
ncbi:unnamed protein product [Protopolystoma xenopodis]|uniref:Uncharacterized protein n=1 Tax=Protopolystoma xenopodis TaxID=117903 RepID=A0A3S5A4M5_9PLAT|nr:unnamed protein product [Protopolystoma xenopodis]